VQAGEEAPFEFESMRYKARQPSVVLRQQLAKVV
jgi:hypothetical protein